jgi:hypothetical protein
LQGRSQDPPGNDFWHTFHVIEALFVTPCFPQDLTDLSAAKLSFIRREVDVWSLLRSLRTTLARATARLSQQSAEVADLWLLCVDLGAEAAAAAVGA